MALWGVPNRIAPKPTTQSSTRGTNSRESLPEQLGGCPTVPSRPPVRLYRNHRTDERSKRARQGHIHPTDYLQIAITCLSTVHGLSLCTPFMIHDKAVVRRALVILLVVRLVVIRMVRPVCPQSSRPRSRRGHTTLRRHINPVMSGVLLSTPWDLNSSPKRTRVRTCSET